MIGFCYPLADQVMWKVSGMGSFCLDFWIGECGSFLGNKMHAQYFIDKTCDLIRNCVPLIESGTTHT